jgi:hypothetical protein
MENVRKLLDEVKRVEEITSDYALAKKLEIPSPRICDYYKGRSAPDEFACLQIAKSLGKTLDEVITKVKLDTEKNEKRRSVWEKHYKQIGGVAASFMILAFSFVTLIVTYPAESLAAQGADFTKCSQYKLCEVSVRIIALVRDMLQNAFPRVYCEY